MPNCPNCMAPLRTIRQREGIFFRCDQCNGRAVTIPQIRRTTGDRFATSLLRQINTNQHFGDRCCPFCNQRMRVFSSREPALELDACKLCGTVWFDPGEFETVPEGAVESVNEVRSRTAEVIAKAKLEEFAEQQRTSAEPDSWKMIPALFGFPVESHVDALSCRPWLTWTLAALIAAVSIPAFFHLKEAVSTFGFVPAEPLRYGGLTVLTSFFLHGGLFHLVGNLYFLLIFGDNVEDYLGRRRYLLLILAAALVGDFAHWAFQPNSTVPCIGASGGISGIIMFYALKFPRARLGFLFRFLLLFRWFYLPAWGALVLWLLLQCIGILQQMTGTSEVASTAHLGGAAVGFALWWWWKKIETRPVDSVGQLPA